MATATGWHLEYIRNHLDLPAVAALERYWRRCPPPAIQLSRIGMVLGIESQGARPAVKAAPPGPSDLRDLAAAGFGFSEGRPNDPMLKFLDE